MGFYVFWKTKFEHQGNFSKKNLKRRKKKLKRRKNKVRTQEKIIQTPKNKIKKLEKIIIAQIMMLALRSSVNKILGAIIIFSSFLILFFGVWIIFSAFFAAYFFFSCVSISNFVSHYSSNLNLYRFFVRWYIQPSLKQYCSWGEIKFENGVWDENLTILFFLETIFWNFNFFSKINFLTWGTNFEMVNRFVIPKQTLSSLIKKFWPSKLKKIIRKILKNVTWGSKFIMRARFRPPLIRIKISFLKFYFSN